MISKYEKELHGTHSEPEVKLSSRSRLWHLIIGSLLASLFVGFGL